MAQRSGAAAQFGFAAESTWGTRVVPTKFLPLVDESLGHERERLESSGIIAGVATLGSQQWNGGNVTVGGDIGLELYTEGIDTLLQHMFGGTAVLSGSGPYVRTYVPVPGGIDAKGLTIQIGRPGVGGTVHPFDYAGCKISSWEIACSEGAIATLGLTVVAKSEVTNQTLATPTYTAGGTKPFKFNHGAVTIGGTEVKVTSATISGDNALKDDRRFISATANGEIDEPLEEGLRDYSGTLDVEFTDLTHYSRFVAGTEHALDLTFTAGAAIFQITGNIRYDGSTPNVGGREILTQSLPIKFIRSGATDSSAITVVTTTSVAVV